MIEVTGVLTVGESTNALAYIKGRRGISPRQMKFILFVSTLAVGIPLAAWVSGSWSYALVSVECAVLGAGVGMAIIYAVAGPATRKALEKRGIAYRQPVTFRLTSEVLAYDLEDLTMTARWRCVTDLYRTRKYWVFLVQSSAMVLPRRFFASPQAERDFIGEAMSRMSAEAQARSPDAARFAGS